MNPLATELNDIIRKANPDIYEMLSNVGKHLFFPKGILSQSAEAKEKAHKFNATIGMATEMATSHDSKKLLTGRKGNQPPRGKPCHHARI